jgi:predicted AAA+ superfamily ATPase
LELIAGQIPRLRPEIYYWHREARASNAEVDYIISHHGQVIPIEVKSGFKGQMQSLYLFLEEKKLPLGLRVSSENFTAYDKIKTIPLYAVPRIYHLS